MATSRRVELELLVGIKAWPLRDGKGLEKLLTRFLLPESCTGSPLNIRKVTEKVRHFAKGERVKGRFSTARKARFKKRRRRYFHLAKGKVSKGSNGSYRRFAKAGSGKMVGKISPVLKTARLLEKMVKEVPALPEGQTVWGKHGRR